MARAVTTHDFTLSAGETRTILADANTFRVIAATGALEIKGEGIYLNRVTAGQGLLRTEFKRLTVRDISGASNTVRLITGPEEFVDNSLGGNINAVITTGPTLSSPVHTNPAVTNASSQILAANAARKYLLIQNKDASGGIYVRLDGAAATTALGIYIGPNGAYEPAAVPLGAITAIGTVALNSNVIVVEG